MEQYRDFEYKIIELKGKYRYCIEASDKTKGQIFSDEWFDTEQEARFAVIGHIFLLEQGK